MNALVRRCLISKNLSQNLVSDVKATARKVMTYSLSLREQSPTFSLAYAELEACSRRSTLEQCARIRKDPLFSRVQTLPPTLNALLSKLTTGVMVKLFSLLDLPLIPL